MGRCAKSGRPQSSPSLAEAKPRYPIQPFPHIALAMCNVQAELWGRTTAAGGGDNLLHFMDASEELQALRLLLRFMLLLPPLLPLLLLRTDQNHAQWVNLIAERRTPHVFNPSFLGHKDGATNTTRNDCLRQCWPPLGSASYPEPCSPDETHGRLVGEQLHQTLIWPLWPRAAPTPLPRVVVRCQPPIGSLTS